MAASVLQVVKPFPLSLTEFAYELLTLAHRPEIAAYGAALEDATGHPIDTIIFLCDSDGDGGRRCCVRFAGPDDPLSMASAGEQI